MSVTTLTAAKRQILQSLSTWRGSLSEADLPLFQAFVHDAIEHIRGPFLDRHGTSEALDALERAFGFARVRAAGEVKVEVAAGPTSDIAMLTLMRDQPFIVDTTRLLLRHYGAWYEGGFNLIFHTKRDESGALVEVAPDGEKESLMLVEAEDGDRLLADPEGAAKDLRERLILARAMVTDFPAMTRAVERAAERFEGLAERQPDQAGRWTETAKFLQWLLRENFVFMGMTVGSGEDSEALGFQRVPGPWSHVDDGEWPAAHEPGTVRVRKSGLESPVHRTGRLDEIVVLPPGDAARGLFIRGQFTYRAITQPSRNVPILRGVLAGILQAQESAPGSFRYKGFANVFDALPTEVLFAASGASIATLVDKAFEAENLQDVSFSHLATGPGSAFALVSMPKEFYSEDLRREIEQTVVDGLRVTCSEHGLFVGRPETVLLYYHLAGDNAPSEEDLRRTTEGISALSEPWSIRLLHGLAERFDDRTADRLADRYGRAFPEPWIRSTTTGRIVEDIAIFESMGSQRLATADLYRGLGGVPHLAVYQARDIYLTDILPVLGNFGIVAIDSTNAPIRPRGGESLHIDLFRLQVPDEHTLFAHKDLVVSAIEAVFSGQVESDRLLELVLSAGLTWAEVDVLRGLVRYCRQLNVKLAVARMHEILLRYPKAARNLITLFHARHSPDLASADAETAALEAVRGDLRALRAHDEHLLISTLLNLVTAMLRTNFYRTDRVTHYLSFKFDGTTLKEMGPRRPLFEIFVHHKEVEGVHLRFGKVARGGLRWSDRDDYRTEVLGLVTTQQVKNVVIVPEGAKGGFFLKLPSRDPAVRRQEADRHYQTFIRGLLDLTDNGVGGKIMRPPRVVCHDPPDPYLVVAADKGTAHLSDTANALSLAYGHWLGDAFASGGSNGYDHKKVGITARGGWVLVKRHFAEMGKDPYTQTFTSTGVGDMSGDVFGNGLIESPHTKLLAAFNHQHIFLDPDPDPASSFEERVRLFKAERKGTWENYDTTKISRGGGIYERSARSVPLSPEAQMLLGLPVAEAEPDLVIHHILRMEVDLLWNGGIGTYVKASTETHADADDRSNDGVRVDGSQLRCRIMGEGGNLGCTQRGRIEAALAGVRLNTDAIDNSGGVDMSDHEVNLKILLDRVVARGDMTLEGRNTLLARMTDEVAALVMADNDAHGRQISRDELRSKRDLFPFSRAISFIEANMNTTRDVLRLPTEKELTARAGKGLGLTRPELAVLSAWVKMYVFRELLRGTPSEVPGFDRLLTEYFPKELQETFADDIKDHMLANEIAMTVATTQLIADAGATFVPMLAESTGSPVGEIAAAYLKAQRLVGVEKLRAAMEEIITGPQLHARYTAWLDLDTGVRDVAGWWLSAKGRIPADEALASMAEAVGHTRKLQPADVRARDEERLGVLVAAGLSPEVASCVVESRYGAVAVMAQTETERSGIPLPDLIARYLAVARASRLQDVLDDLAHRPATGRWDPIAIQILHSRFFQLLRKLVAKMKPEPGTVDELTAAYAAGPLAPVRAQVDELCGAERSLSIPTLIVLEERIAGATVRINA